MALTEEPELTEGQKPEAVLHVAITSEVNKLLSQLVDEQKIDKYVVISEFGLDIAIFLQAGERKETRFLELKAYLPPIFVSESLIVYIDASLPEILHLINWLRLPFLMIPR